MMHLKMGVTNIKGDSSEFFFSEKIFVVIRWKDSIEYHLVGDKATIQYCAHKYTID